MEMFLNAYGPSEIQKLIGLIVNNLDSHRGANVDFVEAVAQYPS